LIRGTQRSIYVLFMRRTKLRQSRKLRRKFNVGEALRDRAAVRREYY
jgi:hypothetical protein